MATDVVFDLLNKLMALCMKHGFVSPLHCQVNGRAGTYYSYGPLGVQMKLNLWREWWHSVVTTQNNIYGVMTPHLSLSCLKPVENQMNFSSSVNRLDSAQSDSFREKLKGAAFLHFQHAAQLSNQKPPFGLAQSGVCLRQQLENNDNMEKFLYNCPEFTELSLLYFVTPKTCTRWFDYWQRQRILWWRKFAGTPSSFSTTNIQLFEWAQILDIQFNFPWGQDSVETISSLEEQDAKLIATSLDVKLEIKDNRKLVTPCVIESVTSLERALLVYLLDAYQEKERLDSKGQKSLKTILRLHHRLAPYKTAIAVLPGSGTTTQLLELTDYLAKELREADISVLQGADSSQPTLDVQYTRFDEMGVPFIVTINDATLKTGIASIRNRDTTIKEQCHVTEIKKMLKLYLDAY